MLRTKAPPDFATLVDALNWRAERDAGRVGYTNLVDGARDERSLTFGALKAWAAVLGQQISDRAEPAAPVLVLCPVGLEYVAAMFACWHAGCFAVPTYAPDPATQRSQLIQLMRASGAQLGVTTAGLLPRLTEIQELSRLRWIVADCTLPAPEPERVAPAAPEIHGESTAMLLFTSGSTASPKGVAVRHRNLLYNAHAGLTEDDRIVVVTPPQYSASILPGVVSPVVVGTPVVSVAPELVSERPMRWLEAISRTRATVSEAPNFLFDLAVRSVPPEARAALDLRSVRHILNRGEAVRAETIDAFESYFAPCGLARHSVKPGYGMSEASRITHPPSGTPSLVETFDRAALDEGRVVRLPGGSDLGRTLVGLGPPLPGKRVEIVDPERLVQCRPNEVGEIWIAGPHVTAGYWQRPEETQAAFGAYLTDTGEGPFFRTGDLGFFYRGELFIAGRLKEVVIVRGRKLFPGDLEATALDCHPAARGRTAAAFAVESGDEEQLVILQEVESDTDRDQTEGIARNMRQRVAAGHGVRVNTIVFVPTSTISRIGQGKVGRAECRARFLAGSLPVIATSTLDPAARTRQATDASCLTETQRALREIWEAVLGVSGIGIDDRFTDLGGDSLTSMRILSAIKDIGLSATAQDIHSHGTIAELSAAIEARQAPPDAESGPMIGPVRLSPRQQSLLVDGERSRWWAITVTVLETSRPLRIALIEQAVKLLTFHHDALRLRCAPAGSLWRGEYTGQTPRGAFSTYDLSAESAEGSEARIAGVVESIADELDVQRGPFFRAAHIHLPGATDLVVLVLHHVISDAYTVSILTQDLDTLYRQLERGEPPRLPPRTSAPSAWLERLEALARSDELREEAAYWDQVARHEPTALPLDVPTAERVAGREGAVITSLGKPRTAALQRLAHTGLTVQDALVYALAATLRSYSATDIVRFQFFSHGRSPLFPDIDLSRTVGYLAAEFPIVLRIGAHHDTLTGARKIQSQLREIPQHGAGYEILLFHADVEIGRRLETGVTSPIRLNYLGDSDALSRGLEVFRRSPDRERAILERAGWRRYVPWHADLHVRPRIEAGDLELHIVYHTNAYRRATVERLASELIDRLARLADAGAR